MKTKKRKKKRIGTSLLLLAVLVLPGALAAKKKKPAVSGAYALITGTVFQESGYALPGADITLSPQLPPGQANKVEKMHAVSSPRGEFVFRAPPGPMQYTVFVVAKGYRTAQKTVSVQGQEREEVTFQLQPESK